MVSSPGSFAGGQSLLYVRGYVVCWVHIRCVTVDCPFMLIQYHNAKSFFCKERSIVCLPQHLPMWLLFLCSWIISQDSSLSRRFRIAAAPPYIQVCCFPCQQLHPVIVYKNANWEQLFHSFSKHGLGRAYSHVPPKNQLLLHNQFQICPNLSDQRISICFWVLHWCRLLGTPTEESWPGVNKLRDWHEYPQWQAQNLSRAVPDMGPDALDLLSVSSNPPVLLQRGCEWLSCLAACYIYIFGWIIQA